MEPTGETPKHQSNYSTVELYAGPCDGLAYQIRNDILAEINHITIQQPCTQMMMERLAVLGITGSRECEHLYIRVGNGLVFRFVQTST